MDLAQHKEQSNLKHKENQKFFKRLKKVKAKALDKVIHPLNEEVFECVYYLKCANYCSTTSPLFTDKDVSRIAKYLRTKPSTVVSHYLRIDEDRFDVLKKAPCTFLGDDNYCSIYDARP